MSASRWLALCAATLLTSCGSSGTPQVQPAEALPPTQSLPPTAATSVAAYHPRHVMIRPSNAMVLGAALSDLGATHIRKIGKTDFYLVRIPAGETPEAFLDRVRSDVRVIDSAKDRYLSNPEGGGATIPIGSELFSVGEIATQPEFVRIGADIARQRATGVGVRIALIDSGVASAHQALAGAIEPGGWDFLDQDDQPEDEANGLDDDGDGWIDEGWGHGTFIASLVLGIAPDARILPYRVLDSDINGLSSDVAEAITQATDAGVQVINLSLGTDNPNPVIAQALIYARERDVMVMSSAGNSGDAEVTYPAQSGLAISVTSVDPADIRAWFACFGEGIDLAAPGQDLIGAYPLAPDVAVTWSGTSFSAALLTGAYALVHELHPGQSAESLILKIAHSASGDLYVHNPEFTWELGRGRLDLAAATE